MAYKGTYRTKSGKSYFRFSFEKHRNGEERIYILAQPSYRGRSTDGHSTHRYGLGSRPYICYEPAPKNRDEAINIAKAWAENTEKYIASGKKF
jgi:hypothetical protein